MQEPLEIVRRTSHVLLPTHFAPAAAAAGCQGNSSDIAAFKFEVTTVNLAGIFFI